jgi:hypothetical protein
VFERPRLHVDLAQLRSDARDPIPLRQRGWQQALESIFPLKFNRIEVVEGSFAYIDYRPGKPFWSNDGIWKRKTCATSTPATGCTRRLCGATGWSSGREGPASMGHATFSPSHFPR